MESGATLSPSLFILIHSTLYEGAEVETDINVLDGDICPRTSPCGHDALVEGHDVHTGTSVIPISIQV